MMHDPGTKTSERIVHVVQGEFSYSADPDVVLSTVLGSCVAACIRDPIANIGGMNHFLLPGGREHESSGVMYGVQAMELLINQLMKLGCKKHRLEAKLFGGARMMQGLSDIGAQNARFGREFFSNERIPCISESLGGTQARRLHYWPASGRARQILLNAAETSRVQIPTRSAQPSANESSGDAELF